jgi:hypothetical protein
MHGWIKMYHSHPHNKIQNGHSCCMHMSIAQPILIDSAILALFFGIIATLEIQAISLWETYVSTATSLPYNGE